MVFIEYNGTWGMDKLLEVYQNAYDRYKANV